MKNNIADIKNCYGCGVCATICAKNIISIGLNKDGFYEPHITNMDQCTNCGLCTHVCSFIHKECSNSSTKIRGYAAWSNNEKTRKDCSSGGIGFEIGKQLVEKGYKVCGVKYNIPQQRAEHYIATNLEELIPSIGSKYIQSYTLSGFKNINRKEHYLVIGTPCQIDSFRRYLKKFKVEDNFILMDFFCHSVPSILAWRKYLHSIEHKTGKIKSVSWRSKQTNWRDSYNIRITGEKSIYTSPRSKGDIFFRLFLGDYCCNPACINQCKYKQLSSAADIRIGDFWGNTYKENEEGVSTFITFTEKGQALTKELKDCTLIEHPIHIVTEGQMKKNTKKAILSPIVKLWLRTSFPLNNKIFKSIFFINQIINRITSRIK